MAIVFGLQHFKHRSDCLRITGKTQRSRGSITYVRIGTSQVLRQLHQKVEMWYQLLHKIQQKERPISSRLMLLPSWILRPIVRVEVIFYEAFFGDRVGDDRGNHKLRSRKARERCGETF